MKVVTALALLALATPGTAGEAGLRLTTEIRRLPDTARLIVSARNESRHRIAGTFTLDNVCSYSPSDSTRARVDARIAELESRGGHVCRVYPVIFCLPKSLLSNDVFGGSRVSLRPGDVWVDSLDVSVGGDEFVELPGRLTGQITLWSGRDRKSWRDARPLASIPWEIPVP